MGAVGRAERDQLRREELEAGSHTFPARARPPAPAAALDRGGGLRHANHTTLAFMVSMRHASCSCGRLRVEVNGPPLRVSVCHCLACQKRTGSIFGEQARFASAGCKVTGESTRYLRVGDEGTSFIFRFCPVCGATVYYTAVGREEVVAIPVGAFADPTFPTPSVSVYEHRKHLWLELPPEIERL